MTSILLRRARLADDGSVLDVLVTAGRVTEVGSIDPSSDVQDVIDLDGRFALPGLWDRHVHFEQWALASARLDLSSVESAAAAVRIVGESIAQDTPTSGTSVIGFGFRAALWPIPPDRPSEQELFGEFYNTETP